ncbi:hypothetical protein [Aureimonas ureilytica]|nr:hypothetical protein [Aureimonas ureilytica]
MSIKELAALSARSLEELDDEASRYRPDDDLTYDSTADDLLPSDPHYVPTVYVDRRRLGGDVHTRQIFEFYMRNYPQYNLNIPPQLANVLPIKINILPVSPDDFRSFRLSNWPIAERLFEDRGYVSPIEARYARRGNQKDSAFVREHLKWLDVSTFMLSEMLKVRGGDFFGWKADYVGDELDDELIDLFMEDKRLEVLGPLCGRASDRNPNERLRNDDDDVVQDPYLPGLPRDLDYALVDYEGLLLGCNDVWPGDQIHLAEMLTPVTSLKRCADEFAKLHPFGHRTRDVAAQINFEMTRTAAEAFFDPYHFGFADAPRTQSKWSDRPREIVTLPDAIMIWYTQIHVVLRKAVWAVRLPEHPKSARDDLRREADVLQGDQRQRPVPVGANGPIYRSRDEDDLGPMRSILESHLRPFQEQNQRRRIEREIQDRERKEGVNRKKQGTIDLTIEQFRFGLTKDEYLTACLCGMRVETPDGNERRAADDVVATWVGRLKREGRQSVNWIVAEAIWAVAGDLHRPDDFFATLLSSDAWKAVVATALRVLDTDEVVDVRYVWSRDRRTPWLALPDKDGVLVIFGPLLSFPAHRSAYWREKAHAIRNNTDFRVDRKPGMN